MVPALPMMLAALLAQAGSSMSDEALADRLIAALPDSEAVYAVDRTADPVELAQLEAANPGRTEEIRPILENHAACEAAMRIAMTRRGLSRLVAQMGAEKVGRLIAFYEGEDFGRFAALTTRLVETASGATMWSDGSKLTTTVSSASFSSRGEGGFGATDADAAYGELVDGLVWDVTDDFRVHYVTRRVRKDDPAYASAD